MLNFTLGIISIHQISFCVLSLYAKCFLKSSTNSLCFQYMLSSKNLLFSFLVHILYLLGDRQYLNAILQIQYKVSLISWRITCLKQKVFFILLLRWLRVTGQEVLLPHNHTVPQLPNPCYPHPPQVHGPQPCPRRLSAQMQNASWLYTCD
jgi:hypothetical protein